MAGVLSRFSIRIRIVAVLALIPLALPAEPTPTSKPNVVRFDPRFDALVPKDVVVEKIAEGFAWTEGPVWNPATRSLLFSDVPNNVILEWSENRGASVFLKTSGYTGSTPFTGREPGSNGLTLDSDGRLVFCQHGDRSISRLEKDGSRTRLAEKYDGKRINSPNDLVFRSNGDLYFTDPPFGLPGTHNDPGRELDYNGVYRRNARGEVSLLTKEVGAPNGIAFSPDEKTLYVADSQRTMWYAFSVNADGSLGPSRVLFDGTSFGKGKPGVADGLKVDRHGNLFAAGPGGLYVISPEGTLLGWFDFGVATGNCAWGEDGSTLFVTSNTAVYRIRLHTRGSR